MKKTFVTLLLLSAALLSAQTLSLDRALDACVAELAMRLPAGTRVACPRINSPSGELSDYVTGRLTARLIRDTRFIVVNRDSAPVNDEINYQLKGNVSDETAVSITAQLGADAVIAGTLQRTGTRYRLDISAIMVEKNTVAARWSAEVEGGGEWAKFYTRRAGLVFEDGGKLAESDKSALLQGLQRGLQNSGSPFTLAASVKDAEAAESADSFVVRLDWENRGSLTVGTANLTLIRGGEALCTSKDYRATELSLGLFLRKISDAVRDDRQFFERVNNASLK
ncbi:MAG: hypothetical protein LBQ88_03420 [Treponema sp.]|nr:hypothetical protein [Treponema sp.]